MRAVVTRVLSASVEIDGKVVSSIDKGFLVLLGVHKDDTEAQAKKMSGSGLLFSTISPLTITSK